MGTKIREPVGHPEYDQDTEVLVGKVGLEPTTAEATDLQSAAIPITLYLPILINTSPIL